MAPTIAATLYILITDTAVRWGIDRFYPRKTEREAAVEHREETLSIQEGKLNIRQEELDIREQTLNTRACRLCIREKVLEAQQKTLETGHTMQEKRRVVDAVEERDLLRAFKDFNRKADREGQIEAGTTGSTS